MMNYVYSERNEEQQNLELPCPREAERAATAAALRTHARAPCTCILRWVHNAHLQIRDAEVGNLYAGFLASLEHKHFACAPHSCSILSRQSRETNTVWDTLECSNSAPRGASRRRP
jgi:hypothetical protein